MASRFPTLAVELVELIAIFLQPADLRSLRLVCRDIHKKTLDSFGRAHFDSIQTDLSFNSLLRLEKIANIEYFAKHVQCLEVKSTSNDLLGRGPYWPPKGSNCLAEYVARTLQHLLSHRLLKCRSFVIHGSDKYDTRLGTDYSEPSDAVWLILSVVARADLALRAFAVPNDGDRIWDTPSLQRSPVQTPTFVKAWSQIEEFLLDYRITSDQLDWALDLMSSAQRLRKLSLKFHKGDASTMQHLGSLQELNQLEELSLEYGKVTLDAILSLLFKNRMTLHSLSMKHITLEDDGEWTTVFGNMKGQFPHLQNLTVFRLGPGNAGASVTFSKIPKHTVVPGSEVRRPNGRLKYEYCQIGSGEDTIVFRYRHTGCQVVGVEYHGKKWIDNVLETLEQG